MVGYQERHNTSRFRINNKGFVFTDLFLMIAILIVMVVIFAGFIYFFGLINTNLRDIGVIQGVNENNINMTQITDDSFGYLNIGAQNLRFLALAIFFGLLLSILISSFLIKVHPVFFIVYFFILITAIVSSFVISNVYEDLRTNEVLGDIMQSFTAIDYVIIYLPLVIIVTGAIAGILMFIGISRDSELGGGI